MNKKIKEYSIREKRDEVRYLVHEESVVVDKEKKGDDAQDKGAQSRRMMRWRW